jgi:hypothetical protein
VEVENRINHEPPVPKTLMSAIHGGTNRIRRGALVEPD